MTEAQWATCDNPKAMLGFLREQEAASDRKLRLFSCACCRRVWHLLTDERSRKAVEVSERFADGLAGEQELSDASEAAWDVSRGPFDDTPRGQLGAHFHAAMAAWWVANDSQSCDVGEVITRVFGATVCDPDDPEVEDFAQAHLLRCLFGNPFRPQPALHPSLLTPTLVGLARSIYEGRAFERMPELADLLEQAGCNEHEVLAHCQQGGVHVRGCWVIDLLLGKA